MKKSYRKPKMKPYDRADNQISALDYMYPGRKGYIAWDGPEDSKGPSATSQGETDEESIVEIKLNDEGGAK